jgi:hypothetical protein
MRQNGASIRQLLLRFHRNKEIATPREVPLVRGGARAGRSESFTGAAGRFGVRLGKAYWLSFFLLPNASV